MPYWYKLSVDLTLSSSYLLTCNGSQVFEDVFENLKLLLQHMKTSEPRSNASCADVDVFVELLHQVRCIGRQRIEDMHHSTGKGTLPTLACQSKIQTIVANISL